MKINIFTFFIFFILYLSCNNAKKNTQQLLGTWEIIQMQTYTEFTENAFKIDFIEGSENKVNLFYLYLTDGSKFEGQWQFYKDGSFVMKFHEGHSGVSDEDQIWTKDKGDYSLSENQFNFKGTFTHYISSDNYKDNYCSIVLKR